MKFILIFFLVLIILSCSKNKNFSKDSSFKLFIGMWQNNSNSDNVSTEFRENGQIIIKRSVERTVKFYPEVVTISESDYYKSNGIYWKYYNFEMKSKNTQQKVGFYLNPTNDTILFPYISINDFTYENTLFHNTYLTRK